MTSESKPLGALALRASAELGALSVLLLALHLWLRAHPLPAVMDNVFQVLVGYSVDLMGWFCAASIPAVLIYLHPTYQRKTELNLLISLPLLLLTLRPLPALFCVLLALSLYWLQTTPALSDGQRSAAVLVPFALFVYSLGTAAISPLYGGPMGIRSAAYMMRQFFDRMLYWWYERKRIGPSGCAEFLFYFFGLPCVTGEAFLPSYTYLRQKHRSHPDDALLKKGLHTMRVWTIALVVLIFVMRCLYQSRLFIGRRVPLGQVLAMTPAWVVAFAILNLVFMYYHHAIAKEMSVGAARMLGYDVHDAYNRPLLATTPADHWRRWNLYWREFLLKVFYYPTVLAISRRFPGARDLATFVACMVIFAGSALLDKFPVGLSTGTVEPSYAAFYFRDMAFGMLVGINLILELHRVRFGRVIKWGLGLPLTLTCASLLWFGSLLQLDWNGLKLLYGHLIH